MLGNIKLMEKPMRLIQKRKTDKEYIESIKKKYNKSKINTITAIFFDAVYIVICAFLMYIVYYTIKKCQLVTIPNGTLYLIGLCLSISVISLFGLIIYCITKSVKNFTGDRTELLLIKYYNLSQLSHKK